MLGFYVMNLYIMFLFPQVIKERQLEDKVKLFSDGLYDFFGANFGYTHRVQKLTKQVIRVKKLVGLPPPALELLGRIS